MIDNVSIGLRTQDFHEALKETKAFGPKEANFGTTLLIGKCASIAMHLKGLLYIDDYTALMYAAAELGVTAIELREVLHQLEVVDFVRLVKSGAKVVRVDIRVPEFRSGYEDLGELWKTLHPTEMEQAGLLTLSNLLSSPSPEASLTALGLDSSALASMQDVMSSGQLIRSQTVSGERLLYTPLAVDNDPTTYLQWTRTYPDEIGELMQMLVSYQGLPSSSPQVVQKRSVQDAIQTGVLMPVRINGATGEQNFLFAPKGGLASEERVVLDKARAILASVRYGQHFAAGRPILYPKAILSQLLTNRRFKQGHPDLRMQYNLLTEKLIGRPVQETNGRWNYEIVDTEENIKAFHVAIDMLELGETPTMHIDLEAKKAMLTPRGYLGPISTRTHLASVIDPSSETQAHIVETITKLTRGITSGF